MVPEISLILIKLRKRMEERICKAEIPLKNRMWTTCLELTNSQNRYKNGRNSPEEIVNNRCPNAWQKELESRARRNRDGSRALQNRLAVIHDILKKRLKKHREAISTIARIAVHSFLSFNESGCGYASDNGVEKRGNKVLPVVIFNLTDHVKHNVAFEDDLQFAREKECRQRYSFRWFPCTVRSKPWRSSEMTFVRSVSQRSLQMIRKGKSAEVNRKSKTNEECRRRTAFAHAKYFGKSAPGEDNPQSLTELGSCE